jgi:hypothetical protein
LRPSPAGFATAPPHSLGKDSRPIAQEANVHGHFLRATAKHRATFGQRVTRSSKPPIRREEVVSDGNWCQLFAKAATKADIEFVGNVP